MSELEKSKRWDKLPRESSKAFAAFRLYLELGPGRTFEETFRRYRDKFGLSSRKMTSSFRGWKDANNWRGRADAFDAEQLGELDELRTDKQREALQRIYARAGDIVDAAITVAVDDKDGAMLRYFLDRLAPAQPKTATFNIAADGTIAGAGNAATAPTGTGSDWSGEKEYDWTKGAPGAGSKMWTVMLDEAIFVLVTNTGNTFHESALHIGRIYVPTTGADDVANGRDGLAFLMGVPDGLAGSSNAWLQSGANAPSLVHLETGLWGAAGGSHQPASTGTFQPGGPASYTPLVPYQLGGYSTGPPAGQKNVGVFRYIACPWTLDIALNVIPTTTTDRGWLYINNDAFSEDVVIIWDKTVTP